jgi:hypothetical protein
MWLGSKAIKAQIKDVVKEETYPLKLGWSNICKGVFTQLPFSEQTLP